jgi:hypothetical protein
MGTRSIVTGGQGQREGKLKSRLSARSLTLSSGTNRDWFVPEETLGPWVVREQETCHFDGGGKLPLFT